MPYRNHAAYRIAWDEAYKSDPDIPLNIDIELASLCNLSCPFCFISDGSFDKMIRKKSEDGKSARRLMPKEMAFQIIDECAKLGVPALKFNWRGESTLHPDYSEILIYAKNKESNIQERKAWSNFHKEYSIEKISIPSFYELLINTNANCSHDAIDGLMASTKVMISLDSMDKDIYQVMRRGGDLNRAKATITELVRRRHPNIWVRRVLTKENKKEDFFRHVHSEWGDTVKVSEHHCFDRNKNSTHEVGCDHDEMKRQYCGYPSQRLIITSTGKVYPCCIDLKEEMYMGKFPDQSIKEIWNSDKMKTLRTELRDNKFTSKICKNCESWMSFKRPERDYVQDVRVTVSR